MKMKAYSGLLMPGGGLPYKAGAKLVKTVVAASSMRKAADILGLHPSHMKNYFDLSCTPEEISSANSMPGTIFQSTGVACCNFKEVFFNPAN